MSFTNVNHYVPIWYQKRFIPNDSTEEKLFYLDLKPDRVTTPTGISYTRNELRRLGPAHCFAQEHLYTRYLGNSASDAIEKYFFGEIDRRGAKAVKDISDWRISNDLPTQFQDLISYLGAQVFRTPKGLDFLSRMTDGAAKQKILEILPGMTYAYGAIWSEATWEILKCANSETKFIISDHPVTLYNRKVFPASKQCAYPYDAKIGAVGTQTIFPMDLNKCLVITHVQLTRNPRNGHLAIRENFRLNKPALFYFGNVQLNREISEKDVRAINYIIKKRAVRFVAAGKKKWLYPEDYMKETLWSKLGNKFFLMPDPRKVPFTTGVHAVFSGGASVAMDEYGRPINDKDTKTKAIRTREIKSYYDWRKEWDLEFGNLSEEERVDALGIPSHY